MILPRQEDFIDIHTHASAANDGIYAVENLLAHEGLGPVDSARAYTAGIHPWFLNESSFPGLLEFIKDISADSRIIALGEAGFDRLRGPSMDLQRQAFTEQAKIAVGLDKPLIIHCVRAWEELFDMHRLLKPSVPWMIHGFRGKKELASRLLSVGMYISFWFDFIIRPESSDLVRFIPRERIFLETDGADTDIRNIYLKVATDLGIDMSDLKKIIINNFNELFIRQKA